MILSNHNKYVVFHCTLFAGGSGLALIIKVGYLVGIHQEAIYALRARLQASVVSA